MYVNYIYLSWYDIPTFMFLSVFLLRIAAYKEATPRVPNDEVEAITSKDLQGSYKIKGS